MISALLLFYAQGAVDEAAFPHRAMYGRRLPAVRLASGLPRLYSSAVAQNYVEKVVQRYSVNLEPAHVPQAPAAGEVSAGNFVTGEPS